MVDLLAILVQIWVHEARSRWLAKGLLVTFRTVSGGSAGRPSKSMASHYAESQKPNLNFWARKLCEQLKNKRGLVLETMPFNVKGDTNCQKLHFG